jgi:hypothetical protein
MNYKIKITAENQAIVKRIADENGMNPTKFEIDLFGEYYGIKNNKIQLPSLVETYYTELTTEKFIEMFDKKETELVGRWFEALENNTAASRIVKGQFYLIEKEDDNVIFFKVPTFDDPDWLFRLNKEFHKNAIKLMPKDLRNRIRQMVERSQGTELDKWLRETKAKNLSLEELKIYITNKSSCNDDLYKKLRIKLDIKDCISLADFLFNQWNNPAEESPIVESEWQPKRGDRVLVWDDENSEPLKAIYLETVIGCTQPFLVVAPECEEDFLQGYKVDFITYKQMKPLSIEQPIETDFKTKVIELIEKRIAICIESIEEYKKLNSFSSCEVWRNCKHENQLLLNQIKEL